MTHYEASIAPAQVGVVAIEASQPGLALAAQILGAVLPAPACTSTSVHGLLHRSAPESMLVLTAPDAACALAARIDAVLQDATAIVADLSDGHAWMRVAGADALDVLSQGVAIDLREAALPAGRATRTLCFGVEAILVRDGRDSLRIGVRASHGEFMAARLALACRPLQEATPCP